MKKTRISFVFVALYIKILFCIQTHSFHIHIFICRYWTFNPPHGERSVHLGWHPLFYCHGGVSGRGSLLPLVRELCAKIHPGVSKRWEGNYWGSGKGSKEWPLERRIMSLISKKGNVIPWTPMRIGIHWYVSLSACWIMSECCIDLYICFVVVKLVLIDILFW